MQMQTGIGQGDHLHFSWEQIIELSQNWPQCRSLDLFGSSAASLSTPRHLPPCLSTIFLADSPCLDADLDLLLSRVPGGLRELGLSWCCKLTHRGLVDILKKHGKTFRLLTLVSGPAYQPYGTSYDGDADISVLDEAAASLPRLLVLDMEGPWATDKMFKTVTPSVRSLIIGRCPRVTAKGIVTALNSPKQLQGLRRLGVVLEKDHLAMAWNDTDETTVVEACARHQISFNRSWSWVEEELAEGAGSLPRRQGQLVYQTQLSIPKTFDWSKVNL